jgi:hypothetical protein
MGQDRDGVIGYFSRLVGGLVACAVVATTLHADAAAVAILAAVMVAVVAVAALMLRDGAL